MTLGMTDSRYLSLPAARPLLQIANGAGDACL
jgi:hypothetical protein